jgi:hypothetical protein
MHTVEHMLGGDDRVELRVHRSHLIELPDEVDGRLLFMDAVEVSRDENGALVIIKPAVPHEDAKPAKGLAPMRWFDILTGFEVRKKRLIVAHAACNDIPADDVTQTRAHPLFLSPASVDRLGDQLRSFVDARSVGRL